jgi:hypothetical protein
MIGKKDTLAIFESYQTHLKEQKQEVLEGKLVMDALLAYVDSYDKKWAAVSDQMGLEYVDRMKLEQFLRDPKTVAAYDAFRHRLPSFVSEPIPAGDASAANMGEGGVLEVQPDGQYSR